MNLIDGLNSELTRAKELLKLYEGIPTGGFGAAVIRQAIKDAEMGIDIPPGVYDFFDGCAPDENGMEVEIKHDEWDDNDMRTGIEINVDNIPKNVKVIRFYNSY